MSAKYQYTKWRRQRKEILRELSDRAQGSGGTWWCSRCRRPMVPLPDKCLGEWHYTYYCPMCDLAHVADQFAKMEKHVISVLGPCPPIQAKPGHPKARPKVMS